MSDNPRGQVEPKTIAVGEPERGSVTRSNLESSRALRLTKSDHRNGAATNSPGADFVEEDRRVIMEAEDASALLPGADAHWGKIIGLGYNGGAVSVFPPTASVCETPKEILADSPCLQYKLWLNDAGDWRVTVRALPTFSVEAGKPQRYAIAFDDAPPQIVSLPYSRSENDRRWQQDVLRNAALTTSSHTVRSAGLHTLKIWMVDPGIVIDTIIGESGEGRGLGYVWPAETRKLSK